MSSEKEPKESPTGGVDLSLVKKLLSELELTLTTATDIRRSQGDIQEYMVETAKATGLAMGIMREATMLVSDINLMVQVETGSSASITSSKKNAIEDLLSGFLSKGNSQDNKNKN